MKFHADFRVVAELPEVVEQHVREHDDRHFRAFALEELLKVVVAVAFGRHGPELTDDGDLGLRLHAIEFELLDHLAPAAHRHDDARALLQGFVDFLLHRGDDFVRAAGHGLEGTQPVLHHVDDVAGEEGLAEREEERLVEQEAELFAGRLLEPTGLLEEQDPEAVEARVADRLAVLGHVHAEAAGTARAGRDERVALDDFVGGEAFFVSEPAELLHEVAHREVRRVALSSVAELLAEAQRVVVGAVERAHFVADALEGTFDEVVVRHRQATDEQRRLAPLARGELGRGHRVDPLFGLLARDAEARLLLRLELRELRFDVQIQIFRLTHGRSP